jgi:AraC-like DNA-binding protein
MNNARVIAELEYIQYEAIDYDFEQTDRPPNLIYYFTRQLRKPHMRIEAIDHMGYCIGIITRGQAVFEHLGQTAPLRYGSVFFRRHEAPYKLYKTDPDELELTQIMFDPAIGELWSRFVPGDCIARQLGNASHIIELTDAFFDLLNHNPVRRIERSNAFAPLLLETLTAESDFNSGSNVEKELAEQCRYYLHQNVRTVCNMEQAAGACHISRSRLYTLFEKYNGMTPKEYLAQLKLRTAADLLAQTDWTLDRIADETGYPDAATFSKTFKRRNGISPGRWRKNTRTVSL